MGSREYGLDAATIDQLARELVDVQASGIEIALVIGGGNIYRGMSAAAQGIDRATGDYMGMIATVLNALAVQEALERNGADTRVLTAIAMQEVAEPYIRRRAVRHLEKGRVVIFAAGTGNPFFTTDTAAALRASEIGAEVLIKATKVDGVYDKDPVKHKDAVRFDKLTFNEVLQRDLKVMDATAIAFCKDNGIPILVLDIEGRENLTNALAGKPVGTLVH